MQDPSPATPRPAETSPYAPAAPAGGRTHSIERTSLAAVLACFLLSGFAALLYQMAWMREFSSVFGTSELAVATVLASYMGGLALGSALAGKLLGRVRRPVLVYGLCELGIALGALAVPLGLALAGHLRAAVLGGQPELPDASGLGASLYYLAAAFVVLAVPTTLMGATLPLLARHAVHRDEDVGGRIGALYAINTLGAVLGTIVAGFVLLPKLGLGGTVRLGVATNALVFVLAALVARRDEPARATLPTNARAAFGWPLIAISVSGAASFAYEVLWTRLLVHVVGASVYAFATMLATFLAGIALGSAIAAPLARSRRAGFLGFAAAQVGIAVCSALTYWALDRVPELALAWDTGEHRRPLANAALAALILLPSTLCIGATFPFALRALARDEHDAASASARVYAWNTLGAIFGAVLTGFFVLPAFGYEGTVRLAVYTNLALALATIFVASRALPARLWVGGAAVAVLLFFQPEPPFALLRRSPVSQQTTDAEIAYYGVGRSTTVLLFDRDGSFALQAGGLPQGEMARHGAVPFTRHLQRWLGALPVLARPAATSMLVIGFGGGACVEGLPEQVRVVDGIELEAEVLAADRSIGSQRIADPLADPRVNVVINDARGALSLTTKRWDLIVSQPSHPWTAGASHLFTREFLSLAKQHLEPGGVYVQWISTNFTDAALFKTVGATLLDSFEHVRLYRPLQASLLIALASLEPLEIERQWLDDPERMDALASWYWPIGVNGVNDVAACLALDHAGFAAICAGAPISTDDDNRVALQTRSQAARKLGSSGLDELLLPHDPLLDPQSELSRALEPVLDRVYLARRAARMSLIGRAKRIAQTAPEKAEQRLAGAMLAQVVGQPAQAHQYVVEARGFDPEHRAAKWAFVEPYFGALLADAAPPEVEAAARALPEPEASVLRAVRAGTSSDWEQVEQLEPELAQVPLTSLAHPTAARFRAEWRLRRSNDKPEAVRPQLALEAIAILDRSIALGPDPVDLILRLEAGMVSGRVPIMLETVHELLYLVTPERAAALPQPLRQALRTELLKVRPLFERFHQDPRVTPERIATVRAGLDEALSRLDR